MYIYTYIYVSIHIYIYDIWDILELPAFRDRFSEYMGTYVYIYIAHLDMNSLLGFV